ncbi:MAG: pyrimidine-nucleoside phosphorylase [Bacillota bacterium]
MRMVDLIHKKRQGNILTKEEIDFIIKGYTSGEIPDYQVSSLLMAIYFQSMSNQEIVDLTFALVQSGDIIDLSDIHGIKVDKHSTGGVGDKVSLIIVPLVASVGVPVAKMSGRGLGFTGGTIDKLEAIAGFRTTLTREEFVRNVNTFGMAISGQTANLAPADKLLYALRDVTDTVDSIPLIASSVMSKKIASGADCIVLDVKVGSGAFMKSLDQARQLARTMVDIGKGLNRKTIAILSDMSQPLGHEVGNANEIIEAINVLKGEGARDLTTIALTIASHMTVLGGAYSSFNEAYHGLQNIIQSGKGIEKLKQLIEIQGGDPEIVSDISKLPQAKYHIEVKAMRSGYVSGINAEAVGISTMLLGAGRKKKSDIIDPSAGVTVVKKIGDRVHTGETISILHTNMEDCRQAEQILSEAYIIGDTQPPETPLLYDVIQ